MRKADYCWQGGVWVWKIFNKGILREEKCLDRAIDLDLTIHDKAKPYSMQIGPQQMKILHVIMKTSLREKL